jgi:hypothetical protein
MSQPNDATSERGQAVLIAEGAPGVEILVINAHFLPVARGVTKLEEHLPEGVYTVRFSAGGRSEDKPVRLLAVEKPLVVEGGRFAIESAPPSLSSDLGTLEHIQAEAVSTLAQNAAQEKYDELVVFVRAPISTRSDLGRKIRLFDALEVAMKSRDEFELEAHQALNQNEHGWAARRYRVQSGTYRLRYEVSNRKTVEQTIYVFSGRRTFAFLKSDHVIELERQGAGYRQVRRHGIDPSKTVLVSTASNRSDPDPDNLRLAEILLHSLGSRTVDLDQKLMEKLAGPDTCPYLKLYAVAVLVRRLEDASRGDDAENEQSMFEALAQDVPRRWLEKTSIELLRSMPQHQSWPDGQCCSWRLAALMGDPDHIGSEQPLLAPPMLDCAWRWAVTHSIDRPAALPMDGPFRAASEARVQGGPWLVWRSAANRSRPLKPRTHANLSSNLSALVAELNQIVPPVLSRSTPDAAIEAVERTQRLFSGLKPPARQFVSAILHLGEDPNGPARVVDVKTVASNLGAQAESLRQWAGDALKQVQKLRAAGSRAQMRIEIAGPATEMKRLIEEIEAGNIVEFSLAEPLRESSHIFSREVQPSHIFSREVQRQDMWLYGVVVYTANVAAAVTHDYIKSIISKKIPDTRIELKLLEPNATDEKEKENK